MSDSGAAPRRILIDADPGVDDSMAILFAFSSPEVSVEGISTVFGNTGTTVTTENALRLIELVRRSDVPVSRGAEKPLTRDFIGEGWRVHGRNGLGGAEFPSPQGIPDRRRGAQLIVDTVMDNPGEITIVALGPLTNVALAVSLEPRIAELAAGVVLMGGAANARGNASAVAEANVRNDPEAAQIVFDAPWEVTMVGLDVTTQTIMTPPYLEALFAARNPYTDFISRIVPHYLSFSSQAMGVEGFPVHDSSAIAYVVDPTLFETRALYVKVETHSPVHFGLTAPDWRVRPAEAPNVNVCVSVDSRRFLDLYHQRLTQRNS